MAGALTAAGIGGALLLCGAGFDSPSLLVPGAGLLGLALVAFAWVELATPSRLRREQGPARIVEDEPYPVRLVASGGRVPPPGGRLTDPVLESPVAVGPRWRGRHAADVPLRGRGRLRLRPARLEVRDPLGLRVRWVESADPGEVLVLPRIEPVRATGRRGGGARTSAHAGIEDGAVASRLDARAIELEVDGLRAYREGSPASRIHWPAVARTGELVERRLIAGADSAPLIVLDATRPAGDEALDAAVRAAASLCVHLGSAGGCALLLPGDRRPTEIEPEMRTWPHVHARLAVVEASAAQPSLSRAFRAGAVFWVTAAARPALPKALRTASSGRRYLVAPLSALGRAPSFEVAGCGGAIAEAHDRPAAELLLDLEDGGIDGPPALSVLLYRDLGCRHRCIHL
ncbi:MAG: DUF58 domain-containing protein, partial [Solirubrobacterales bacterium]|nr:DUF58 domain-containing protein [Solirubrobacterales bacterium]